MATAPRTSDNASSHESDQSPEAETHRSNELIGVRLLVMALLGLFVLVTWLLSMAPE